MDLQLHITGVETVLRNLWFVAFALDAMSAVSAASPFVLINNAIAVLLGIGSGSVLSRAIGKKDKETVDKIKRISFLGKYTNAHERIFVPLARVENKSGKHSSGIGCGILSAS